jgi:hypothetical protein
MKIDIDIDDIIDAWKAGISSSFCGPTDSDISPIVKAICDVSKNHYQAASFLIEGALEYLQESDISNVLAEHGYQKIPDEGVKS